MRVISQTIRLRHQFLLFALLQVLAVAFSPLQVLAQDEIQNPAPETVAPDITAPELAPNAQAPLPLPSPNLQRLNARAPFFWAEGITRADELEAYQRAGMNTVVVRLIWRPSDDGAINTDDLLPQRRFAQAAAERGLNVIYALPATPFGMERAFRVTASSAAYFNLWSMWAPKVMEQLADTPRLLGWMLPDDPRSLPYYDDIGWQKWLGEHYAEVGFLDQSWNTNFKSFDDITLQDTQTAIDAWRGARPNSGNLSPEELEALNRAQANNTRNPEWAWHPAALAVAQFKWDAYRELLSAWTNIIKSNDAEHLLFSGRLPDYAQLLALPPGVDFSVPDLQPGVVENDALTHNPQAVSIARRGGRFRAIPTLTTTETSVIGEQFLHVLFPHWAETALASGASGLALSSWPDLLQNGDLRGAVRETLARLSDGDDAALWKQQPVATTAVVLTPLADGVTLQTGGALSAPRGLYGFGDYLVDGGANDLAYEMRWGTAFGGIDWLSPDDIDAAGSVLRRYSTVFLPQALSLPTEEVVALNRYAQGGGVVVCDLGAGCGAKRRTTEFDVAGSGEFVGHYAIFAPAPHQFQLATIGAASAVADMEQRFHSVQQRASRPAFDARRWAARRRFRRSNRLQHAAGKHRFHRSGRSISSAGGAQSQRRRAHSAAPCGAHFAPDRARFRLLRTVFAVEFVAAWLCRFRRLSWRFDVAQRGGCHRGRAASGARAARAQPATALSANHQLSQFHRPAQP